MSMSLIKMGCQAGSASAIKYLLTTATSQGQIGYYDTPQSGGSMGQLAPRTYKQYEISMILQEQLDAGIHIWFQGVVDQNAFYAFKIQGRTLLASAAIMSGGATETQWRWVGNTGLVSGQQYTVEFI